ncbi:hypothetical protein C8Q80DRAFT_1215162 [Daedaleopsis nitida]|nr:hypothetical protein C8Q80DRAFT_1215162 [Daedaleopsis nitida]
MSDSTPSATDASSSSSDIVINVKGCPLSDRCVVVCTVDAVPSPTSSSPLRRSLTSPQTGNGSSTLVRSPLPPRGLAKGRDEAGRRVLKDEDALSTYKIQTSHTIHMVKGAARSGPAAPSAAPQQLPTMQAGQNPHDPLTQLNGPMGFGLMAGLNPFAEMGLNPNDPNMMQTMLNSPEFLQQMSGVMANPAVLDQIIASNPQLAAMGPQVREVFRSERFRQMMSNPDTLRMMLQMSNVMRESGGPGAMGGLGGLGGFGGLGGAGAGGFPAPGLPSTARQQQPGQQQQPGAGSNPGSPQANPFQMPFNNPYFFPFGPPPTAGAGAGADASGTGAGATPGAPGATGAGSAPAAGAGGMPPPPPGGWFDPAAITAPPEERFQVQLQQLQDMGFTNASQNVRALLATGGNVHSAIEYILNGGGL